MTLDLEKEIVPRQNGSRPERSIDACIEANQQFISNPTTGALAQQERISSECVESTMNEIVCKRMFKCRQMQWTKRVAHLLSQTWTQVLNGKLAHISSLAPAVSAG